MQLLKTKIKPPSTVDESIARPRLLALLGEVARASLAIVRGAAGYGKSSLLVQWFSALEERGDRCGWYSFGEGDRDPREFLAYVALTLAESGVRVGAGTRTLLATDGATTRTILASLLGDLEKDERPAFVFLDDAHLVRGTPLEPILADILALAPAHLHVVLATRHALDVPLARLRAAGRLFELDAEALRFSAAEMRGLWSVLGNVPLDPEQFESLGIRTEGWVTGLKLAALAARGNADVMRGLAAFSGRRADVAAFFAEEVLSKLDPELQEFLMKTSILERFSPELAAAVAGDAATRAFIDDIERSGLFLFSLDDDRTWYRYHHLFADFLRRRLHERRPAVGSDLHRRASGWFRANGYVAEAFDHAIRGEAFDDAARILESCCQELFYGGRLEQLSAWVERVPEATLRHYPHAVLTFVWKLILEWKFDDARRYLAWVRDDRSDPQIPSLVLHREMMLAQFEDDMPLVATTCHELLRHHLGVDPYVRGTYDTSLIYAQRERFVFGEAEARSVRATEFFERSGSRFVFVWHDAILGPTRFAAGDAEGALDALERSLAVAISFAGRGSTLASVPGLQLAEVRYERNEIDAAQALVDEYLDVASEIGFVDQLVAGYLTASRLCRRRGDEAGSRRILERGLAIAGTRGFERLRRTIAAEEIGVLLARDGPAAARRFADAVGSTYARGDILPRDGVTTGTEAAAVVFVRLAAAAGDVRAAASVARLWRGFAAGAGAVRSEIRWSLLFGDVSVDDERAARRSYRHALGIAAACGYRSMLIDARAPAFAAVLACATPDQFEAGVWAFVDDVRFARSGARTPAEPTAPRYTLGGARTSPSAREREILTLVGRGMLNREIADALGLSVASVKWHLQQVYNKTGTRRRARAAALLEGRS